MTAETLAYANLWKLRTQDLSVFLRIACNIPCGSCVLHGVKGITNFDRNTENKSICYQLVENYIQTLPEEYLLEAFL